MNRISMFPSKSRPFCFQIYISCYIQFASNWLQFKCWTNSELKGFDVLLIGPSSLRFQLQSVPTVKTPDVKFGVPCNLQAVSCFDSCAICNPRYFSVYDSAIGVFPTVMKSFVWINAWRFIINQLFWFGVMIKWNYFMQLKFPESRRLTLEADDLTHRWLNKDF